MILLYDNINIFDEFELDYLENNCNDFNPNDRPDENPFEITISTTGKVTGKFRNFYNRFMINEAPYYEIISEKITNFLNKKIEENKISIQKFTKPSQGPWINRVDSNSNKNDKYHTDQSDISVIIYLNDSFEGGEFEYLDKNDKPIKIKPKKYSIIISSQELSHRVLPVSNGVRYSLVAFFNFEKKVSKTLL
jgi:hypothetical protein